MPFGFYKYPGSLKYDAKKHMKTLAKAIVSAINQPIVGNNGKTISNSIR